jgi:hypothetical protein
MMFDMSDVVKKNMQAWFEREFALDGVLAAGGGVSATSVFAGYAAGEFVLASNEEVWRSIGETVQAVSAHGAPTGEMIWGFERAVLCTIRRPDGAWLGVITEPDLRDDSALALRAKLDAFKQQNFAS